MKKSLLIAALVVAAGLFAARPSYAQLTTASGDLGTLNSLNQTEGTFHVFAQQASPGSDTWNVTVNFVGNGPAAPPTGAYLDQIQVKFATGGTVALGQLTGGHVQSIVSTLGGVHGIDWVQENTLPSKTSDFEDPGTDAGNDPTAPVDGLSVNDIFKGSITLSGLSTPIDEVQFDISNTGSGEEWFGTTVTPEGSSLALLLPGLIPLALVVRRRRKA